jgi:hypothetical protein
VFFDTGDGVLGTNMYAYCQGDPVNFVDPGGRSPAKQIGMAIVLGALVGTFSQLVTLLDYSDEVIQAFLNPVIKNLESGKGFWTFVDDMLSAINILATIYVEEHSTLLAPEEEAALWGMGGAAVTMIIAILAGGPVTIPVIVLGVILGGVGGYYESLLQQLIESLFKT